MCLLWEQMTAMSMLCAIIPWDHTCAIAYLHIMEMDEFAQVNYSLKITKITSDKSCLKYFLRLAHKRQDVQRHSKVPPIKRRCCH